MISSIGFLIFFGRSLQRKALLTITFDGIIDSSSNSSVGYIPFQDIERFCIVVFDRCGNGMKIRRGYLLHHFSTGSHLGKMGRFVRRARCYESGKHGAREERLLVVDLGLGEIVASDLRETRHRAEIQQLGKFGGLSRTKTKRGEVVLVDAGICGQRDGGQKLLDCLVFLAMYRQLLSLDFFQAQVVLEAHGNGLVQREPQGFIAGWMSSNTAEERIRRGGWVGGWTACLRDCNGSRGSQSEDGQKRGYRCREENRI